MGVSIVSGPIIEAGESLSSAVDCSAGRIMRITTPAEWTPAHLSFQISSNGEWFDNLHLPSFGEVIIKAGPGQAIAIDPDEWPQVLHLKIRSGTSEYPTVQEERREFSIALETDEAEVPA